MAVTRTIKIADLFKCVMQEAERHFDSDPEIVLGSNSCRRDSLLVQNEKLAKRVKYYWLIKQKY